MATSNALKQSRLIKWDFLYIIAVPAAVTILYYGLPYMVSLLDPKYQDIGKSHITWIVAAMIIFFILVLITRSSTDPKIPEEPSDIKIAKSRYESSRTLCSTLLVITGVFVALVGPASLSRGAPNLSILMSLVLSTVSIINGFHAISYISRVIIEEKETDKEAEIKMLRTSLFGFWKNCYYQLILLIMAAFFIIPGVFLP